MQTQESWGPVITLMACKDRRSDRPSINQGVRSLTLNFQGRRWGCNEDWKRVIGLGPVVDVIPVVQIPQWAFEVSKS